MPRRLIQQFLPPREKVHNHPNLRIFGERLQYQNLWHLNRYSVAGATALGFFVAYLPVPFQMVIAAMGAIVLRVNLPISVLMVWISNPLTWVPLYLPAYKLGAKILGSAPPVPDQGISLHWLLHNFEPLFLGCLIVGSVGAGFCWLLVMGLWRWHVVQKWSERKRRRKQKNFAG